MSKVESFHLASIDCWFNSQEHRPPHFHARRRGSWHVRVFFLEPKSKMIRRAKGPRGRIGAEDIKTLAEMAESHREELLREWEKKVSCDD